ncbi:MAG: hypothetical protein GY884_35995 [Proteobacteria bacterium]|nr:hypothetical protein [Pseudomonadota bacterium]
MIWLLACKASVPQPTVEDAVEGIPWVSVTMDGGEDPGDHPDDRDWFPASLEVTENGVVTHSGRAGLHTRGNSSTEYDKKSYALETWDSSDEDLDVALVGLPAEEDWVLQGPYSDKTLVRNHLIYGWSHVIDRYASRIRLVELEMMGDYRGVYVAMEKIKQDSERIDLDTGDALLKRDWIEDGEVVIETATCGDELLVKWSETGVGSIEEEVSTIESELLAGDYTHVDIDSFIDHMLLVELGRNVDGYVLSTWIVLEDGVLRMGPVWDYNGALGNADYFEASEPEGWHYSNSEFPADNPRGFCWYEALLEDDAFISRRAERWREHRASGWSDPELKADIDAAVELLGPAADRNFERWPVLGEYVWPNDEGSEDRSTHAEEVQYMTDWLMLRTAWLDSQM